MIRSRANVRERMPCPLSDRAAQRRREAAAEEARWEAQLRRLAKAAPQPDRPAAISGPAPVTTLLALAGGMERHDTLLIPRTLPIAVGSEGEDLACGKCGGVIAARSSRESLRRKHPDGDRLLVRCPCRALNLVCDMAGTRSGYRAKSSPSFPRSPRA